MTWSDRAALRLLALLLPALLLAAGCGRERERGFALLPGVESKAYRLARAQEPGNTPEGLSFPRPPEIGALDLQYERRPVVLTAAGSWRWRGEIPAEGGRLRAGVQLLPAAWQAVRIFQARVVVHDGGAREVLDVLRAEPGDERRWLDLDADLARYAGREVTLEFSTDLQGLPARHQGSNLVAWGPVALAVPPAEEAEPPARPSVLLIVVDTLRHDRLTPYGYHRPTSPEIARRLAIPGAVVEEAYSQAPWTLPSVTSFLTGRYPGEMLGKDLAAYGIPPGVETLAERMRKLGYETGGFVANPSLHAGAGFERGFRTFFAPPADIAWMNRHADDLNARALPWLRAHQDRPFFLYVHYIDPHDPYSNPDMVGGRSPFMPHYTGPVAGDWIHGIYNGKLPLENPARDVPYIRALYDSEVRYVDRHIGRLLDEIDPKVLANTLIVLTSDHGEELYDHGGWKHGQTLYEEQIHVPLLFRWDGRIEPGTRLAGTVRLVDLLPTLMSAAGGEMDPEWDGLDLLPALTGAQPLQRRPAFAQHLAGGPLRAAAVLDRRKLLLYNRAEPFQPVDEMQEYLWKQDQARLRRAELYDLSRDPRERRNVFTQDPATVDTLAPVIHRQLGAELPGLWVLTDGAPPGARLGGSITFQQAPQRWTPYFLGEGDRVELAGNRLTFDLACERIDKGFRVEGDFGRVEGVAVQLDGQPLPPGRVLIGQSNAYGGGPIALRALRSPRWPLAEAPSVPGLLRIWMHEGRAVVRREASPETEKRLRNLGYIQ